MHGGRWRTSLVILGGAILYLYMRREALARLWTSFRGFSAPSARIYDALADPVLNPFYGRVAREVGSLYPAGTVLDVGCGPGRLAVRLAQEYPGLQVTGVDISPDMIEMASGLAASRGVADRVHFRVGDAGALPFPERHFDLVVSTLSLHHWPDRGRGISELYRVLKPGGWACIYDVADWFARVETHGPGLWDLAESGPFRNVELTTFWALGPLPMVKRLYLGKEAAI